MMRKIYFLFLFLPVFHGYSQEVHVLYNFTKFSHGYSVSEYQVDGFLILNYWGLPAFDFDGDGYYELPSLESPGIDFRRTGMFRPGLNFERGEFIYNSNSDFLFTHSPKTIDLGRDGTIDGFISRGGDDPYYFPKIDGYSKNDYRNYFQQRGAIDYSNILLCDFAVSDRWFNGLLTIYHPVSQFYRTSLDEFRPEQEIIKFDNSFENKLGEKFSQQTNYVDGDLNNDGLEDYIVWGGSGVDGSECTETLSGIDGEVVYTENKFLGIRLFYGQSDGTYESSLFNYDPDYIVNNPDFNNRDHPIFGDGNAGVIFDYNDDGVSEIFTAFQFGETEELGYYNLDLEENYLTVTKVNVDGGYRIKNGSLIPEDLQSTQFVEFFRSEDQVKFFLRYTITHDYYPTYEMDSTYVILAYEINKQGQIRNITSEVFPNNDNSSKHLSNWSSMYMIDLDFDGDKDLYIQDGENGSAFGKEGLRYSLDHPSWNERNSTVFFKNNGNGSFSLDELVNLGTRTITNTNLEDWDLNDLNNETAASLSFVSTNSSVDRMLPDFNRYMPLNYDNDNIIDFFSGGSSWGENSLKVHSSKEFPEDITENFGEFTKYRIVAPNIPLNESLNQKLSLKEYNVTDGIPLILSEGLVVEIIDETKRDEQFKPRSIITLQDPLEKYSIFTWAENESFENFAHTNLINFKYGKGSTILNQRLLDNSEENLTAQERLNEIIEIVNQEGEYELIRTVLQQYNSTTFYTKTDTIKAVKSNFKPLDFTILNVTKSNEGSFNFSIEKSFDPDSNNFNENNANVGYFVKYHNGQEENEYEIEEYISQSDTWDIQFEIQEEDLLWIEIYAKERGGSDQITIASVSDSLKSTLDDFDQDGVPDLFDIDDNNDGILDHQTSGNEDDFDVKEYVSFNGISYDSYFYETAHTVVYIEKSQISNEQLNDSITLNKILRRIDSIYEFYKGSLGYEPSGGVMEYGYKSPVFFGPPSCGSGCGLIGSKGIEVSGFNEIFFHLKNELNVTRDIIIAYEFGRNFSNENLGKIISPNTEKNGGFYEEFASYMAFKFYDQFLIGEERKLNETLVNDLWFKQKFLGYINDLDATPENSLFNWDKIQMQDMNRGNFGNNDYDPSYSGSILIGILKTLNIEPGKFLESLSNLSRSSNSIDVQSNIAIASSISNQKDYTYFFKNVLKFSLSSESLQIMSNYPSPINSLIRDMDELYFINNTDSITLNVRSVLHNRTDKTILYRIFKDDSTRDIISESSNGNNSIPYSILKGTDKLPLKVELIEDGELIDTYDVILKSRKKISLLKDHFLKTQLYSYYLSNKTHRNYISNDTLYIKSISDSLDHGIVYLNLPFSRNRNYKLSAKIKHSSQEYIDQVTSGLPTSGWSSIIFDGPISRHGTPRVGYDLGSYSDDEFYNVTVDLSSFTSNFFMPDDGRPYFMNRIRFESYGYNSSAIITDVIFEDITDSDQDGIIDFEDNCPNTPEGVIVDTNGCEVFSLPKDVFSVNVVSSTCIGSDNGSINLSTSDSSFNYLYSVNGSDPLLFQNDVTISGLATGSYQVCFTVEGVSNYNRCYTVKVGEPAPLEASSMVDMDNRTINLNLSGSKSYNILLNGKSISTDQSIISLPLQSGKNTIEVKGDQECQGLYFEEIFVSEEVKVYPNPTNGPLQLYVSGFDNQVTVDVTSINGTKVMSSNQSVPMNRVIEFNLSDLNPGMYIVSVKGSTVQVHQKVIRR